MKSEPLVSIIIVNWNGGEVFKECLQSLSGIDYAKWELIVVDNGSTDGSEKLPTTYKKIPSSKLIVNSSNLGFAVANNQGSQQAAGKYILLLNNDTKIMPNFLAKMVDRIESDPNLGVIQPKILIMDKPDYLDNAGSFFTRIGFLHHWGFMQKDGPEFDREREIFSAKGACMLIRKKVVDRVGLFDKDYFSYFEESDFCWRVWLAGYKVLYYPQAVIYHKVGFTIKRLNVLKINYHYYKNRVCSLIKNLDSRNFFITMTLHLIISLGIAGVFLLRFKFESSLMIIKAIWWNVIHLNDTLQKRKIVQNERKVSDGILWEDLSYPINWMQYWRDFRRVEKDMNK